MGSCCFSWHRVWEIFSVLSSVTSSLFNDQIVCVSSFHFCTFESMSVDKFSNALAEWRSPAQSLHLSSTPSGLGPRALGRRTSFCQALVKLYSAGLRVWPLACLATVPASAFPVLTLCAAPRCPVLCSPWEMREPLPQMGHTCCPGCSP